MFKVSEVAEMLNCSESTVYALVESGELEHYRCPGIRVSQQQIDDYLERSRRGRTLAAWSKRSLPDLRSL